MKSDTQKKAGELQPIPPCESAWQQITTDVVTDLPESEGKTAIAIFVDRLTKMTYMVPCTEEVTASMYAWLFMNNIFCLHGMPKVIISHRDPMLVKKL